jgi:hypothetical protein
MGSTPLLNYFFILTSFLLLSTFTIFHITDVLSQDDDGFFGIFPNDYYDPRDYGEIDEEEQTPNEEIFTADNNDTITHNYLSDIESKDINFIAAGDWNCNK